MNRPACFTCRTLHHRDEAPAECARQLEADVVLLNSKGVVICGHGYGQETITRETVHALASVVRLLLTRTATPGELPRGGRR